MTCRHYVQLTMRVCAPIVLVAMSLGCVNRYRYLNLVDAVVSGNRLYLALSYEEHLIYPGEHGEEPVDRQILAIGTIPLDQGTNVALKLVSRRVDLSDSILLNSKLLSLASTNAVLVWEAEELTKLDMGSPQYTPDMAVHGGATNFTWVPIRWTSLFSPDRKTIIGQNTTTRRMSVYDTETMKSAPGDVGQALSQTPVAQFYADGFVAISDDTRILAHQAQNGGNAELWQLTDLGWKTSQVKLPDGATISGCQNVHGECELLVDRMDVGRPDKDVDIHRAESGKMQDLDVGLCDQTGKIIGHTNTLMSASDLSADPSYDRFVRYKWQGIGNQSNRKTLTIRVWHPKTGVEEVITVEARTAFDQMAKPIPSTRPQ